MLEISITTVMGPTPPGTGVIQVAFGFAQAGIVAYYFLDSTRAALPYALAVAASSFIYVAVADLIPRDAS